MVTERHWHPIQRLKRRAGRFIVPARGKALAGGLVLLAVPTFWTVIPGWTRWDGRLRAIVLAVWIGTAVAVLASQLQRDEKLGALTEETQRQRRDLRLATLWTVLEALLRTGTMGFPIEYEFTVYLPDGDELKAVFPKVPLRPGEHDVRIFKSGDGATGSAWRNQSIFVVTGGHVHSDRHGLTPEQQHAFRSYRTVASTPIWAEGEPIGTLTALSTKDDGYFGDNAPGVPTLERLAQIVGVVLKSIPQRNDLLTVTPPP